MNSRRHVPLSWLLVAALVAALGVTVAVPAVGGPKTLTVAQAKKLFLKKSKAKKTYVTQQSAAASYLPRTGETRVSIPLSGWKLADNTSDAVVTVHETDVILQKNSTPALDVDFFAQVAAPTQIGGTPLRVVGIELCYDIVDTALVEPIIDRIALQRVQRSAASPAPIALTSLAVDDTGRVDDACATIRFAPVTLLPTDLVGVGLRVDFNDAATQLRLGAGSLILTS